MAAKDAKVPSQVQSRSVIGKNAKFVTRLDSTTGNVVATAKAAASNTFEWVPNNSLFFCYPALLPFRDGLAGAAIGFGALLLSAFGVQ